MQKVGLDYLRFDVFDDTRVVVPVELFETLDIIGMYLVLFAPELELDGGLELGARLVQLNVFQ